MSQLFWSLGAWRGTLWGFSVVSRARSRDQFGPGPRQTPLTTKGGIQIDFTMKAATEKPIMDLIFRLFVCVGNAQKWNAVCNNDSL